MKNDKAFNAMEYIDSSIIDEVETYKPKKSHAWAKWSAMAACLCLVVAGTVTTVQFNHRNTMTGGPLMTGDPIQAVEGGDSGLGGPVPGGSNYFEAPKAEGNEDSDSEVDAHMMIGHYDKSLNETDMAVNNGHYELSNSLKAAINEFGDGVTYRVVVEVFKDGTVINSGSPEVNFEMERLAGEKYVVAHEIYEDTAERNEYFTLHAEEDQLLHFSVNEAYGYYISLYDEYLGLAEPMEDPQEVFNRPATVVDAAVDESTPDYLHAAEYPAEILEIQQAISDAMARGDLPYVYESCICENPLRIEVYVNVSGEKLILANEAISSFDPTGGYVVVIQGSGASQEDLGTMKGGAYVGG